MARLWSQSSPEAWQAALERYGDAVAGLGKERLPDLDRCVPMLVRSDLSDQRWAGPPTPLTALLASCSAAQAASWALQCSMNAYDGLVG